MNCIANFDCDYVSPHGLIENVNIVSVSDDDCTLHITSNQTIIRTSIDNVKIIIKPHERILKMDQITDLNENLILSIDGYKCMVNAVNRYEEDDTVDVVARFGLLLDNETTKRVSIDNLMICGVYESVKGLKSVSMEMPFEYSRYFNNVSIFRSILSRGMGAAMVCWDAERCELRVSALNESDIHRIEFVLPVFASQLSLLIGGRPSRPLEMLASLRVWEYQYESELEANIAIGPQGAHIIAVRALRGIAGVVLTKSNRLRLIAENKAALREARSLLEIRRDTYLFDDSFIPILIGKSASRISELVAKSGLHCIHVPNSPCSVHLNDHVSLIDRSISKKRELSLYGTRESIASARLLLEVEESVRDLKKEFEQSRNTRRKLRQSQFSLKSSSTSSIVSKESRNNKTTRENEDEEGDEDEEEVEDKDNYEEENEEEPNPMEEDVFERPSTTVIVSESQPLSWADTRDDDDPKIVSGGGGGGNDNGADSSGVYTDFFSSSNATSTRPTHPRQSVPPANRMMPPQQSGPRRPRAYPRKQFGLLFTNSALCGNTLDDRIDQQLPLQSQLPPSHRNRPHGMMGPNNHGNSGNNNRNWGQNQSGFRPKPSIDRRVQQHSQHQQQHSQHQSYHQKQRRSSPTGGDHGNSSTM